MNNNRTMIFSFIIITIILTTTGCAKQTTKHDPYLDLIWETYPELVHMSYTESVVRRIIDGDTFELASGHKVRLIGVNTPEITNGASERYGQEAKLYVTDLLQDQDVILFADAGDVDRYGRLLRYVFVKPDHMMLNERLVSEGYANTMTVPPNVTYADRFVAQEQAAREAGAGLWGDEFATIELTCEEPLIKGNINSRNDRIYHVPGSLYYDQTIAEIMFCTVEEAEAAGFRAPKR